MILTNLIGELRIMKDFNIKPNFSALQRETGVDRHTIRKYYDNDGIPPRKKRISVSKWDPFLEEVKGIINKPHVSYKAAYMFMFNKYGKDTLPGDYNSFRNYLYSLGIKSHSNKKPHVLYETPPGKQSQFDWKEDMCIHLKDGTLVRFNVFSLTLSYSREHIFIYSSHKTTEDLLHCFIKAINKLGGTTREYLTDNMSAIVSLKQNKKSVYPKIIQFFKDINSRLVFCKPRTPETKGKDENANKFIKWIYAYDYCIKSEQELINIIENTITTDANNQVNTSTLMPPSILFEKEKEYLTKLPNKILLDSYLVEHYRQTVPNTQLIYYNGSKYSLPSKYINETVNIYPIGEDLYIYHNHQLIAKHNITQQKINYQKSDYIDGLTKAIKNKENKIDIETIAIENIERLSKLGGIDQWTNQQIIQNYSII